MLCSVHHSPSYSFPLPSSIFLLLILCLSIAHLPVSPFLCPTLHYLSIVIHLALSWFIGGCLLSPVRPQGEEIIIFKLDSVSRSLSFIFFSLSVSLFYVYVYNFISFVRPTFFLYSFPLCLYLFLILILILCLSIALLPSLCPPISAPTLHYLSIVIHLPSLWIDGRLSVDSSPSTERRNHYK